MKTFWTTQNSSLVISSITKLNKRKAEKQYNFLTFFTLYKKTLYEKVLYILTEISDFAFKGKVTDYSLGAF